VADPLTFLKSIDHSLTKAHDRALALLWFVGQSSDKGITATEICRSIEAVGHPGQNVTRMAKSLAQDKKRVSRVPGSEAWRLHPRAIADLDKLYVDKLGAKKAAKSTDTILPRELFNNNRSYIEKVVYQINASYDAGLFDCCAVMCRRLLETLIIETYEAAKSEDQIRNKDGHFFMFSDLLRVLLADKEFNVSRNAQKGLKDFKALGDQSAHNRRFNARGDDIDRVRDGIRVASEELLHLAKLI
jgi:hypothetical protein